MSDLFSTEQKIFDNAVLYATELKNGAPLEPGKYTRLTEDYGKLLKQFRKLTIISDRATIGLNTSKNELLDKVYFDALTGIYNRWFLEDNLQRVIRTLSRDSCPLSLLMVDIDFFKNYNDTYGHNMGDECLTTVAETIAGTLLRGGDFVARYGGEEFLVILPSTEEKGAHVIARRILKNIRALHIPHTDSKVADHVTVSIGATTGKANHTCRNEDYIKYADRALYHSKQNGRDRYTYVDFKEE